MSIKHFLSHFGMVRTIIIVVILALIVVFIFRKQVREHKVTRTKIEMFRRMMDSDAGQWDEEWRNVLDSMWVNPIDSSGSMPNDTVTEDKIK